MIPATMETAAMIAAMRRGQRRSGNRHDPDRGQHRHPAQEPAKTRSADTGLLSHDTTLCVDCKTLPNSR
jgi:hypothetical protein